MREGGLNPVPEYYRSTTGNVTVDRLRGLDTRFRIPVIELFLSGICQDTQNTILLPIVFHRVPLITGLLQAPDESTMRLRPDNEYLTVTESYIIIGSGGFPVTAGSRYHIKVYNLDLEGSLDRTTT